MMSQRVDWPLTLSLALNLVLVVFIAIGSVRLIGAQAAPHGWGMAGPPREHMIFMRLMQESMASVAQEQPGLKDDLEKKRKELTAALVTEPFKRDRFEAAHKEFDAAMDEMRHLIKVRIADRVAAMPLAQRRDLAAVMSHLPPPLMHPPVPGGAMPMSPPDRPLP